MPCLSVCVQGMIPALQLTDASWVTCDAVCEISLDCPGGRQPGLHLNSINVRSKHFDKAGFKFHDFPTIFHDS